MTKTCWWIERLVLAHNRRTQNYNCDPHYSRHMMVAFHVHDKKPCSFDRRQVPSLPSQTSDLGLFAKNK